MKRITFTCMVLLVGVCAAFVLPAVAQHEHPAGDPSKLGKVSFPVSCEPSVQPQFGSAVAMLHSFWVRESQRYLRCSSAKRSHVGHGVLGNCHDVLPSDLASAWIG